MGGMFGGFMEDMFRHMDARRKAEKKAQAGVTLVDGLEGIPRLNIPHKYYDILISDEGYFSGHTEDAMTIYDKEGKILFDCHGVEYLGYGMFLVGRKPESVPTGKQSDKFGYALYDGDKKITDQIFKTTGWNDSKFNKEGFAILTLFEGWSKKVVVNKSGEILISSKDYSSDYIYLKGIICLSDKKYINLLTGETICEKQYSSDKEISTNDLLFVEVDKNCVYQINKSTGEFIVHGEIPKKEEPKPAPVKYPEKPAEPKIKVPQRNDECPFCRENGIVVKFKKCKIHFNG
jgi:hypothetical protein